MKQTLYFLLFLLTFGFCQNSHAQSLREPQSLTQRADDGFLVAYPNPVRDFIFVKVKDPQLKIKTLTFFSILGSQVAQYSVNMNSGEINLDRLRAGKYLMKYTLSDNTQRVTQIIKQ